MRGAWNVRDWSLRRKLPFIVVSATAGAFLVAGAALLVMDAAATRAASARDLDGLAEILSHQSSAALAFRDEAAADRILGSLRTHPDLDSAVLYDAAGAPLAAFRRDGSAASAGAPPDGVRHEGGRLQAVRPILQEGRRIGTVAVVSTLGAARARLQLGLVVVLTVLAASSLVALLLALRLGRMIVNPVAALAGAMEDVSRSRRYDTRVPASSADEIGRLVQGFNAMLAAIQERDGALARTASIIEAATDFVGLSDIEGRCLYLNAAAQRMIGIGEGEDLRALRIRDFHSEEVYELLRTEGIPAALRDGMWRGETSLRTRTGRTIPVSQVVVAHRGPDGAPAYLSTILRDMSEVRQAQEALRRSEEQLQMAQKMEALGRLAGGIAHDFNNLLTVMGGHAQLLSQRLAPGHPLSEHPETIAQAVDRAGALTRQLLAFSRRQVIQPRLLDLNTVVKEAERMLRRLIDENIEFATTLAENLPRFRGDPGQMDQILMNLVVNARDAMPGGGRLTVSTGTLQLDAAEAASAGLAQEGPYLSLSVQDSGVGMDAQTLGHLFEPFFTTKEKGKGTGLGLATVYGIVRQSGGAVAVRSQLGAGTTFRLLFPAAPGAEEPRPARGAPPELSRGSETLLVVEDEPSVRAVIRASLGRIGYEVLETSHPDEALAAARRHPGPIHLLVSDVVMPGRNGPELARELLALRPGLKVLLISGYPEDALGPRSELEQAYDFLHKPFSPDALAAKVRACLDRPRRGAPGPSTPSNPSAPGGAIR